MAEKRGLAALLLIAALILAGCGAKEADTPEDTAPAATFAPVSVSPQGRTVAREEGEEYYPDKDKWVYYFQYAYPRVSGEDYAAAAVNESYQMALEETRHLVLPMLANEETTSREQTRVRHDFSVKCNNDRLLSILQTRRQTAESGETLALEGMTFDLSGAYAGEALTLRGCILALISEEKAEDMTAEKYPQAAKILAGSSDEIGERLASALYPAFLEMQQQGVCRADVEEDDFEWEFSPAANFYVNEDGAVVFFFPPTLLASPSFDVPQFHYTPAEIEAILD